MTYINVLLASEKPYPHENEKVLGVFTTPERAQEALENAAKFFPRENLEIVAFELDRDEYRAEGSSPEGGTNSLAEG